MSRALFPLFVLLPLSFLVAESTPEQVAFFDQEVFPILESKCFSCHGEKEKLKGDFRITSREGLLHGGELGTALNQAELAKSSVLEMISYKDEHHMMPPKAKLPAKDLATLTKWVLDGAIYNPEKEIRGALVEKSHHVKEEDFQYWAYKKVTRPALPGKGHPVDAFVDAKLAGAGVKANTKASRQTLIRRATYDLTGLPPTPAEVAEYVADPRSDDVVWKALIDQLLARPQYGEKWARHWLDLVRYAESNGFERDNPKPHIWRYRDYVINALNSDVPYDQFVIEQLAGDEIKNPTMESVAATGFHRLMQWDDEPADRKQHTYDVLADNLAITTETFLGSTIGCARCHDHKIDPFTQKDYYSFMAFFHGVTSYNTPGTLVSWANPKELAAFEQRKEARLQSTQQELSVIDKRLKTYLEETGKLSQVSVSPRTFVEDARAKREKPTIWEYTTKKPTQDWKEVGYRNKMWIKGAAPFGTKERGVPAPNTSWNTSDIWMRTSFGSKEIPDTLALELYHDEDVEVYLNGVEIFKAKGFINSYRGIELGKDAVAAFQTGRNVVAVHVKQTGGGQYIDLALRTALEKATNLNQALQRGNKRLAGEVKAALGEDLVARRNQLQQSLNKIRKEAFGTQINAVKEFPKIAPLHVHVRGSAHAPGEEVQPAFPGVLMASFEPAVAEVTPTKKTSGRRLALANWIASAENPLTTRVMVNRIWQHHFGRGIVKSTSDFGKLGDSPTHSELLDWLASEFVAQGWSLKKLHRLIMTSAAYQRSSSPNDASAEKDAVNDLFWRYNMRRLTAEEVRDSVLAVSGNLNPKMGGNWVCPPLPSEVLATQSRPGANWPIARGDEAFRRSIYVHMKRSLRVPILVDFDQADTDGHCAVRFATTVPTQALGMLNSKFVNEQAKILAKRSREKGGADLKSQIRFVLEIVSQRAADDSQVKEMEEMAQVLKTEAKLDDTTVLDRIALVALNLNEFVYLD